MKHKIFKLIYFDTLINTVGFKFDHVNGPLFFVTFHKETSIYCSKLTG